MKKTKMKKWISTCLAIVMVLGLMVPSAMNVKAADYTITEATFFAQRLDVVCVMMNPLEEVYDTYNKNFNLTAVDENSGYYVNGVKTASSAEYTQWGLHPTGTVIKGVEYAPGDYFEIIGTFTETLTNKTYDIDLHMYCVSGGGTGVSSTAQWKFLEVDEVPAFLSVTGISDTGNDAEGAYATLTTSKTFAGNVGESAQVTVAKDGKEATITFTKTGANTIQIRTTDNVATMTAVSSYTIPSYIELAFAGTTIVLTKDYNFYVSRDGISFAVPLSVSYQNCEEIENGWKLVVNNTPALSGKGTIGSAVATLQSPNASSTTFTIEKVKAGAVSAELNYYLDQTVIGTEVKVGTTLTIQAGELSETVFTTNDLELLWDGETWTDQKSLGAVIGDANGDKVLNAKDVLRYKNVLANITDFDADYVSDLNKDASTDEFDIAVNREMVVGIAWQDVTFDCSMNVTSPVDNETVYPYIEKVYQFLTTENADIWDYVVEGTKLNGDGSLKDITISWEGLLTEEVAKYANKYVVEYATKADFSDAIRISVDAGQKNVGINNLYKASDYYVRVTAYAGVVILGQTEPVFFRTTDIGPRVMTVDGIFNVRDLGGYMTESGKRTVQGLLYRGGEMDGTHGIALTEDGDDVMSNLMGIKYDMDFRGLAECNYVTESPISSASKTHHIIGGYTDVFGDNYKEEIRKIFATFADKNNYPIYYHCWGGADRTGTISFLVNGLCGVSEKELIQDYEFTSYSIFGVRADNYTAYKFDDFLAKLKTYEGDTLSAKIETYLLSIGVTADEIYNIKAIMFGEQPIVAVNCPEEFDRNTMDALEIGISNGGRVSSIYIEGEEIPFAEIKHSVKIMGADMPSTLADGQTVTGKAVLTDGTEKTFYFVYSYEDVAKLSEYWDTETGMLTINTEGTVSSDKAVGYGNKVLIELQSNVTGSNGGLRGAIGSYGFELRGGEFRTMTLNGSGVWTETERNTGMGMDVNFFDVAGSKLVMSISMVDGLPVMYLKAMNGSSTKEFTYTFPSRISGEIASESAKVSFYIRTAEVPELIIRTGTAEMMDNLSNYWATSTGEVVLDSGTSSATSDKAVGYGKQIRIDLQTVRAGDSGSLYIVLGSYGVRLRAGTFRMALLSEGGTPTELSPRVEYSASTDGFKDEGAYLILETEVVNDTEMKLLWKQVSGDGAVVSEGTHTFTRIANEIASADAKITFANTASEYSQVSIKVGKN